MSRTVEANPPKPLCLYHEAPVVPVVLGLCLLSFFTENCTSKLLHLWNCTSINSLHGPRALRSWIAVAAAHVVPAQQRAKGANCQGSSGRLSGIRSQA